MTRGSFQLVHGWPGARLGRPLLALLACAALVFPAIVQAQEAGRITGRVSDANTAAPVASAQVYLEGTGIATLTRQDGRFLLLNVPPGTYQIVAERIGMTTATQQVAVAAGQAVEVDLTMETQALGLDEIVVTGTAGAARRREIGNTITQIEPAEIAAQPVQVSDMLQATAPGLDVYGGGAMGQSKVIRLRGTSSAQLNDAPIIYVDGVRIRSIPLPDANPPDRRGGRSGNIAVSPLDMINPNDIARIEVIKGAAATTLYGTEAAGGVIQIFTKRGTGGAPVWSAEVQAGTEWSRAFGVSADGIADPTLRDLTYDMRYNNMQHWLCTGLFECGQYANQSYVMDYSVSVRGGSGDISYYASGSYGDAQGYLANDTRESYSARSNLSINPADNLQIQWNTAYSNMILTSTAQQNNAQGIVLNAFRAPRNYLTSGDPAVLNELLEQQIDEQVERFTSGATLTYSPLPDVTNRFTLGYDWTQREHRSLRPYGWTLVPKGALLNNTYQNRVLSLDYVGTYSFDITDALHSDFSWGGQAVGDDRRLVEGFGEDFPGAALPTLNSAAITQSFEERSKVWNAGFFFQNVFGFSDKYFLTAGVRVDGNSAFGEGFGLQTYPKASASWILSDEDFYPDLGEMKLRLAYGKSGRAPGPFDKVRTWDPEGLAGLPAFVPDNVGNRDLGPEVTTEIEGGFDATWLDGRLSTSFTYYQQITDDLLLFVPQLPSGGFSSSQLMNVGKMKNDGIEVQVNASVLETADWGVDLGLNMSTNHSEILELDNENLITGSRRVGYPIRPVTNERIANPNQPVNSLDEVEYIEPGGPGWQGDVADDIGSNDYLWGSNLPTTFISPSISIRTPWGIQFDARGDYKGGFYIEQDPYSVDRSVRSPLCFPYYQDPANSNELKADIPALWYSRCNAVDEEDYVWDGTYFKLRSVSATIPVDFAFPDRVGSSVLTIALNNSWLWMKEMPFMDPETSDDPDVNEEQSGYEPEETVPPPISLRIALRVMF